MTLLNHDEILQLRAAAIATSLVDARAALLGGIDHEFVAGLPLANVPGQQVLLDLHTLNDAGILADGSIPLVTWLQNATALSAARKEADLFQRKLEKARGKTATSMRQEPGGRITPTDQISIIFERYPQYPSFDFSIVNRSAAKIQIAAIHLTKVAELADDHGGVDHLLGPRTNIEWDLHRASAGAREKVFGGDQIANLLPQEMEAFRVTLTADNLAVLIDIEVEYLSGEFDDSQLTFPDKILVIHAPTSRQANGRGTVSLLARADALGTLLHEQPLELWSGKDYADCSMLPALLLRGVAALCRRQLEDGWNELCLKYRGARVWGIVLASFAELSTRQWVPPDIVNTLNIFVRDPAQICLEPTWDGHAAIVAQCLLERHPRKEQIAWCLDVLDHTMQIPRLTQDENDLSSIRETVALLGIREFILNKLKSNAHSALVEYLITLVVVTCDDYRACTRILLELLGLPDDEKLRDETTARQFWWGWWMEHVNERRFSELSWQAASPRLAKAAQAISGPADSGLLVRLAADPDPIVRLACLRRDNPPSAVFEALSVDDIDMIRLEAVRHPRCSLKALRMLATDRIDAVRRWAAGNPSSTDDVLTLLATDRVASVRARVAANSRCSSSILELLACDVDPTVREEAAQTALAQNLKALPRKEAPEH